MCMLQDVHIEHSGIPVRTRKVRDSTESLGNRLVPRGMGKQARDDHVYPKLCHQRPLPAVCKVMGLKRRAREGFIAARDYPTVCRGPGICQTDARTTMAEHVMEPRDHSSRAPSPKA